MICLSRIKSPVTIRTPTINQPLQERDLLAVGIDPRTFQPLAPEPAATNRYETASTTGRERFDAMADLRQQDTLVMICLSGGGARSARMAVHTLAGLEERYNELYHPEAGAESLASRIDAWSTSSGGSVYASFAALQYRRGPSTNLFQMLAGGGAVRSGTQRLGSMSAFFYLWPLNLGYAPLMQVFTDWDTLDLFAHNLALFHAGGFPLFPFSRAWTLGDLPDRPRFYFNATCRDTCRPFIFTQSVIHRDLSGDPMERLAPDPLLRWLEHAPTNPLPREPFLHASTMEDLGSAPGRFPLAYAAMGSAAFPGVFEPLPLRCYRPQTNSPPWWLHKQVSVVDGGLYDNSGVTTALDLFDYLRSAAPFKPKKLILLAVDADNERQDYVGPQTPSIFPWRYGLPLRGATAAVSTLKKLYASQQALAAAAARHHIRELEQQNLIEFLPVRLKDVRGVEAQELRAGDGLEKPLQQVDVFGLIKDIPTDFVVTTREDRLLQSVVRKLLSEAPPGEASLADRFARAVAPAAHSR